MNAKRSMEMQLAIYASVVVVVAAAGILLLRVNSPNHVSRTDTPHSTRAPTREGSTTAIHPAQTVSIATALGANKANWDSDFAGATSYFDFVTKASLAALNGDGSAAREVSMALNTCLPLVSMYGKSPKPEEALEARLASNAYSPQWLLDKARKEFQLCKGFIAAGADAFANLPARQGGYNSIRFWTDLAVAEHDPVAISSEALVAVNASVRAASPEARAAALGNVQVMIDQVIVSNDPTALFQIGQVLADSRVSTDPTRGFAIALAACDMGYDCSSRNALVFGACTIQSDCAENLNYADLVRKAIGAGGYARAYEQAQEFEQALARGDISAARQIAQLTHSN